MPSPDPRRAPGTIPGLTGARGLACVAVVVVHTLALTAPDTLAALHLGLLANAAVTFFFSLSGFLLVLPFLRALLDGRPQPALRRYALQRVMRIFPAYVVIFVVADLVGAVYVSNAVVAEQAGPGTGTGHITDPLRLLEQVTLVHNVLPDRLQTGINPSWSLTTELCFYVVLPAAVLLSARLTRAGTRAERAVFLPAVAFVVAGVAAKFVDAAWQRHGGLSETLAQFGPYGIAVFSRSLLPLADAFGWGMAAAAMYTGVRAGRFPWWTPRRCRRVTTALLVPTLTVAATIGSSRVLVSQGSFALASGAVLALLTAGTSDGHRGLLTRLLDRRPLHALGLVSLSLYLWHYPVLLLALRHRWTGADTLAGALRSLAVVGSLSVLLAAVTYGLVERPAQRWAHRRGRPAGARVPVAIVHDYLTQRGGAERVVLALARTFPGAPIYTSLYDPAGTFPEFADLDVRPSPLNRIGVLRAHHRLALPLLAPTFSRMRVDADVVIASSSGWAHGVRTRGRLYVYCYSPARWLYQSRRYLGVDASLVSRVLLRLVRIPLRVWDRRAATRALLYLAISNEVRERIAQVYRRDAVVVMSPLPKAIIERYGPGPAEVSSDAPYLCVSRLMPYKNVDVVVEAFNRCPRRRLVVVGGGPDRERLTALAGPNTTFVQDLDDDALATLYARCRALIAVSYEDFGLTPLEAAAAGRPSVVLRWGGYVDTMVDGVTAVFVEHPNATELVSALDELEARRWDGDAIRERARFFDEAQFAHRIRMITTGSAATPAADRTLTDQHGDGRVAT